MGDLTIAKNEKVVLVDFLKMSAVLNTAGHVYLPTDTELLQRLRDLFSSTRTGIMGPDLYRNGGADKFEKILKGSGEYTPFFGEVELLGQNKEYISEWAGGIETAIIVGPGPGRSVAAKEIQILSVMPKLKRIITLELSPTFNKQSAAALRTALPQVDVYPFEVDFRTADLSQIENSKPALVITTGSFTNYEDCQTQSFPSRKVLAHLARLTDLAGANGKILWGYNSNLNAAQYNTDIVDDFLMYPLEKASKMDNVRLDPKGFKHETRASEAASTLTHYWVATKDQDVRIHGEPFAINSGELFPMFFSVAQSPERLARLLDGSCQVQSSFYKKGSSGAVIHGFDCI